MEIKTRSSNFSQFSKDLWLTLEINDLKIDYDIQESDIKGFVLDLLSLCEIALYKQESDNTEIECRISEIIEELNR